MVPKSIVVHCVHRVPGILHIESYFELFYLYCSLHVHTFHQFSCENNTFKSLTHFIF